MPAKRKKLLEVADRIHSAAIHLLRGVRRVDASAGVSGPRLSALSVLVFGGPRTLGELATAEQVKAPTMTRLVDAMQKEGLVVREGDAKDARKKNIRPTAKGTRLLREGRKRRVQDLMRRMAGLSSEDVECLATAAQIMEKLSH